MVKLEPLTDKEARTFMWIFMGLTILVTILLIFESGEFSILGYTVWEKEDLDYYDQRLIDQGKSELIMELYPSPNELKSAIDNNEFDYELLTPMLKQLYDGIQNESLD